MGASASLSRSEEPTSEIEEEMDIEVTSDIRPKPLRRTSNVPTDSVKSAVTRTLSKMSYINTSRVFSETSQDSFRKYQTPKTMRSSGRSFVSLNSHSSDISISSNRRSQHGVLISQPSRLSYGSVTSNGSENPPTNIDRKFDFPVNQEIFSKLHEGSAIFVTNKRARTAFIKFIRGKSYTEQLMKPLHVMKTAVSHSEGVEKRIGGITFQNYKVSGRYKSANFEESMDHFMSRINLIQALKIADSKEHLNRLDAYSSYNVNSGSSYYCNSEEDIFEFHEMKSICIATLFPLFLESAEYRSFRINEQRLSRDRPQTGAMATSTSTDGQKVQNGSEAGDDESHSSLNTAHSIKSSEKDEDPKNGTTAHNSINDATTHSTNINLFVVESNANSVAAETANKLEVIENKSSTKIATKSVKVKSTLRASFASTAAAAMRRHSVTNTSNNSNNIINNNTKSTVTVGPLGKLSSSIVASLRRTAVAASQAVLAKMTPEQRKIQYIYTDIIDSVTDTEFDDLLRSGSWIADFQRSVYNMPVSLSIATASGQHRGFPTVYVNSAYENLTLYHKRDVIGRTQKLLQGNINGGDGSNRSSKVNTEKEQVQVMSHALCNSKPCKVAICNVRKDGREMFNFVSLHPVFGTPHKPATVDVAMGGNEVVRNCSGTIGDSGGCGGNVVGTVYDMQNNTCTAHDSDDDNINGSSGESSVNISTSDVDKVSNRYSGNEYNTTKNTVNDNVYKYVIGIQYDIANYNASLSDIRRIDDYVLVIANMLR